jgi:cytochrome c biogenesis protein CcdA
MESMMAILALMFVLGAVQGLTVCNLTCGPLLILRLAGQSRGAREGLGLSFLFSLPRIVILTLLGAILGALGFSISALAGLSSFPWFQAVVYVIIAVIMIATGIRFIGIPRRKKNDCDPGLKNKLLMSFLKLGPRKGEGEKRSMIGLGILVSLICFVEASGASLAVAQMLSLDTEEVGTGILTGSATMFAYSLGLSVPLLILGSGASEMGRRFNREDVRAVGGILLIFIGIVLLLFEFATLIIF